MNTDKKEVMDAVKGYISDLDSKIDDVDSELGELRDALDNLRDAVEELEEALGLTQTDEGEEGDTPPARTLPPTQELLDTLDALLAKFRA